MASSVTLNKEKLAELVKCVLCMKTFTSPQTMKCLHTFCKHCLENHAKRSSVDDVQGLECPRCKQFTAQSDVTACARTERFLALNERVTKPKVCIQCETEAAEWKCHDCDEFYCKQCKLTDHDKVKVLQRHKWSEISDMEESLVLEDSVLCETHALHVATYFCFDCKVLLCSLCLLQGHDGHKRDTVHSAVDHVKSNVEEKLAAVKQITNERFLRAEKLKDTRLLIQTYADESFDAIKTRYDYLKQKLDDDYNALTAELKRSVDEEFEKVNAAIVAEEAKQSQASAVTSYVENTLATNSEAMLIQESIQQLIPTVDQFRDVESDFESPVTTSVFRFKKTDSLEDFDGNMVGEIESIENTFYGRYQPVITKQQLEGATVGKTIDINLEKEAKSYRINVGYGKILVCLWNLDTILIYNSDGTEFQCLDLSDKLDQPTSAVFVDASHIITAATNGLALVNLASCSVESMIAKDRYSDVCFCDSTVFALNVTKKTVDVIWKNGKVWTENIEILPTVSDKFNVASTTVALPNCIDLCNHDDRVLQFNLAGELIQTVIVNEHAPARSSHRLCAVDADGRMLLSVGGQLVLQHNDQSQVINLDGTNCYYDIVFEDQHTFWILDMRSLERGQYKLIKYIL